MPNSKARFANELGARALLVTPEGDSAHRRLVDTGYLVKPKETKPADAAKAGDAPK